MLDARDGTVVTIEVPDPTLLMAGWARDRTTVVARGRFDGWLDRLPHPRGAPRDRCGEPGLGRPGPGGPRACAAAHVLGVRGAHRQPGAARAAVVPDTASVSNTEGWVAGGVFLPGAYQSAIGRSQGLVAVHSDLPPTPRVLAASNRAARAGGRLPGTVLGASRRGAVRVAFGESGFPRTRATGAGVGRQRGGALPGGGRRPGGRARRVSSPAPTRSERRSRRVASGPRSTRSTNRRTGWRRCRPCEVPGPAGPR